MASHDEEFSFLIAVEDFDKSLLPAGSRQVGTDAFRTAVTKVIEQDYKPFGGNVVIRVDDKNIEVCWRGTPDAPHPLDVALKKLKAGNYPEGVRLLETLRRQQPDSADVLYNLGMALSDMSRLDEALAHLRRAVAVQPDHANARVAVGVALARQKKYDEAVTVLEGVVRDEPDNPWAQRNLGACLLQTRRVEEAEAHLRRAVELNPSDQQSVLGLAQVLQVSGNEKEADELYVRVISMDGRSPMAEVAREARSKLAQTSFRSPTTGNVRMDAVMYLLGAMQKFDKMNKAEVQKITFEIAMVGQRGLDTNDSAQKYTLKSLPGKFSGLHMVCMMYEGFRRIAPEHSIGFDLSKEFAMAEAMHRGNKNEE